MKTLTLNLKEGNTASSIAVPIDNSITLDASFIDVVTYFDKGTRNFLFQFNHQQNSYLNVTDVSPYMLLFFDEEYKYIGATLSIKNGTGNFTIITQHKYVLFLKMPHDIKAHTIENFQSKED